jgi:hypothetical protein
MSVSPEPVPDASVATRVQCVANPLDRQIKSIPEATTVSAVATL